jgi:hydroxymethylpyrimidine pyrophosphatase-like HAD family hydrolase
MNLDAAFYVAAIGNASAAQQLAEHVRRLSCLRAAVNVQAVTYHPQDIWVELSPPGVSKASEILAIAKSLRAARIVCFGDNHGDLGLFEIAHESYAVANATEAVRARATATIASNADGGVVEWLDAHAR